MFKLSVVASLLAVARVAIAHGTVKGVTIDGKSYKGAVLLNADPANTPVRKVTNQGEPIFDVKSSAMICGTGSAPAPVTAPVKAGSTIQVDWQGESVPNWFHNTGPMINYMASCDGDCSKFNPDASTKWFKISEQGKEGGQWAQAKLDDGSPASVTIPSNLASGNYLLRHEIIALQNGINVGGAEFYPACIQLAVSGGPGGRVAASPSVNFPGTYSATDPGIHVDVFTGNAPYQFPGGPVSSISSGGGSDDSGSNGGDDNSAPASSSAPINVGSKPASTSSAAASKPTQCKKKSKRGLNKRNATAAAAQRRNALNAHRKRRLFTESS